MAASGRANRQSIVQSMGLGDRRAPPEPVSSPPVFQARHSYSKPRDSFALDSQGRPRNDSNASRATSVSQRTARRQSYNDGAAASHVPSKIASTTSSRALDREPSQQKRSSLQVDRIDAGRPSVSRDTSTKRRSAQIDRNVAAPALNAPAAPRASLSRDASAKRRSVPIDRPSAEMSRVTSADTGFQDAPVRRRSTQVDRTSRRQSLQLGRPASQSNASISQSQGQGVIPFGVPVLQDPPANQAEKPANASGGFLAKLLGKNKGTPPTDAPKKSAPKQSKSQLASREPPAQPQVAQPIPRPTQRTTTSLKDRKAARLAAAAREAEESDDDLEFKSFVDASVINGAAPPPTAPIIITPESSPPRANGGALQRFSAALTRKKSGTDQASLPPKASDFSAEDPKKKKRVSMLSFGRKKSNDAPKAVIVDDTRRRRYNTPATRKPSAGSVVSVGGLTDLAYVSDDSRSVISTRPLGLGRMSAQEARARRARRIEQDDTIEEADEEDAQSSPPVSRRVSRERPRNSAKNRSSLSRDRPLSPSTARGPGAPPILGSNKPSKGTTRSNGVERGWTDDEDDFEEANDDNFTSLGNVQPAEPADVHDDDNIASVLRQGNNIATLGPHLSDAASEDEDDSFTEIPEQAAAPSRRSEEVNAPAPAQVPEPASVAVPVTSTSSKKAKGKKAKAKANDPPVQPRPEPGIDSIRNSAAVALDEGYRQTGRPVETEPEVETKGAPALQAPKKTKKKKVRSTPVEEEIKPSPAAEEEELPVYDERLARSAPMEKADSKGKKPDGKTALAGVGGLLGAGLLGSVLGNSSKNDEKAVPDEVPMALDPENYDNTHWDSDAEGDYFSHGSDSEAAVVAAPHEPPPASSQRAPANLKTTGSGKSKSKGKASRAVLPPVSPVPVDSDEDEFFAEDGEDLPRGTTSSHVSSKRKPVPPVAALASPPVSPPSEREQRPTTTASSPQRNLMAAAPLAAAGIAANDRLARRKGADQAEEDDFNQQMSRFKTYGKKSKDGDSPKVGEIFQDPTRRQAPVSPTREVMPPQTLSRKEPPLSPDREDVGGAPLSRTKSPPAPAKPQKSSARSLGKKPPPVIEPPMSRRGSQSSRRGSLRGKKGNSTVGAAALGAAGGAMAADLRDDDPAVLRDEDDRVGELRPLKRQSSKGQSQRPSSMPSRKPSKRSKAAYRELTPIQRHYLLKALVCIQMQSEWEELEKLGALTQYGFPFSLDRPELTRVKLDLKNEYTTGDGMDDDEGVRDPYAGGDGDEARRLENLQQPYILRHLFHTHLTTFPGLKDAPIRWWQQRIQVFFDEVAARNFSTSLERAEYSRRRFFSLAATRYLGVYFARGIGVRGSSELRGPGPGEAGSDRWGVGKQWGKGTVKRGLDQPARIDAALWKKIDNLFGDGPEGEVWRKAGKESTRIRTDWQAWKESIIENEDGLDETINYLDVSKIRNLPPKYRNAEEWARNHAAYLLHSLFVSSPQADSVFGVVKGIHTLFPYWGAKQLLKYANAQVLIEGILNLLLARPAGAKSLIQRVAAYVIGSEATTLQKEYIGPLKKELADKELTNRIEEYVARGSRSERNSLKGRAEKTGDDILTVILLAGAGTPLPREVQDKVIKMQHAFARSPYRGSIDLAYPASSGYAKANTDKDLTVPTWDATRAEADDARKYAQLKLYLRDCLKKRDCGEAVKMASGSLLPTIIKETLSIVFYNAIKEISKVSDLSGRLGDLQAFVEDMIDTKKKKDNSIQAWIALAARHENSLYFIFHECVSISGPLFEWCQIGLDFMALSTSDPVHPADRSARNVEVNLEDMLQDRRLTDRDVDLIMEEVDELAVYTKWTKVAYELQLRQNYLLARPDAATSSQLTEEDIPTEEMKEEVRDVDALMRELMEDAGVPIDDGTLPNESRGTEARYQAQFWFDTMDPLGQHLKAEKESEELQYTPPSVTPPIPCLKYVRKLLPVFNDVLREKLPDWENGDGNGPARVKSPGSERSGFMEGNGGPTRKQSKSKGSSSGLVGGFKNRLGGGGR